MSDSLCPTLRKLYTIIVAKEANMQGPFHLLRGSEHSPAFDSGSDLTTPAESFFSSFVTALTKLFYSI